MFLCWWKHTLNSGYELRVSPHRQTDWGKLLIGYCRSDDVSDCRFGRPVVSPCKRTLFILTLCLYTYIFTLIAIFFFTGFLTLVIGDISIYWICPVDVYAAVFLWFSPYIWPYGEYILDCPVKSRINTALTQESWAVTIWI